METAPTPTETKNAGDSRLWIAYVAPMAVFMLMTGLLEPRFPKWYPWIYLSKVCLVSATLVAYRVVWKDIRFDKRVLLPAILVGLAVFVEWIVVDPMTPHIAIMGTRTGGNPFVTMPNPIGRTLFLAVRFFGLVVMVPVMEELFWRSFLLRYITSPDYEKLPMGTFSWGAFACVAFAFGSAHPEWLAAIICACAYGLLLRQTKSLFACVVAHGVTNLVLGIYVLMFHQWKYW